MDQHALEAKAGLRRPGCGTWQDGRHLRASPWCAPSGRVQQRGQPGHRCGKVGEQLGGLQHLA